MLTSFGSIGGNDHRPCHSVVFFVCSRYIICPQWDKHVIAPTRTNPLKTVAPFRQHWVKYRNWIEIQKYYSCHLLNTTFTINITLKNDLLWTYILHPPVFVCCPGRVAIQQRSLRRVWTPTVRGIWNRKAPPEGRLKHGTSSSKHTFKK